MVNFNPPKNSLRKLSKDKRDFPLGAIAKLPLLTELPESFRIPILIKDQNAANEDDFCSAYASGSAIEPINGKIDYPAFSFASGKQGHETEFGNDLRSACKARCDYGFLPVENVLPETQALTPTQRRYFSNYSDLEKNEASKLREKTFFKTSGSYDPYDNVRAWIYSMKRPVVLGVVFGWNIHDYVLDGFPDGFGHAITVVGYDSDGLDVTISAGIASGKEGHHRLTRATANKYILEYGAYMFTDYAKEEAVQAVNTFRWSGASFFQKIALLFQRLFA